MVYTYSSKLYWYIIYLRSIYFCKGLNAMKSLDPWSYIYIQCYRCINRNKQSTALRQSQCSTSASKICKPYSWTVLCRIRIVPNKLGPSWSRHPMETFSALPAFCVGSSPVTGEFPSQRPVTRIFDVFFDLRLNQQLCKQWRRRWFETQSCSLWRHCNGTRLLVTCWRDSTNHVKCLIFSFDLMVSLMYRNCRFSGNELFNLQIYIIFFCI